MTNNLGITAVTQEHSKKEKMLRRKYMGVWSQESAQVMLTMMTLPTKAASVERKTHFRFRRCHAGLSSWSSC
ncbi:Killer Cell Immunoglobulin-Like Receptor-Like Protein Kir3Dx1-Like [Manis pentadactyla]|nr:Killer Cell Immunoglobulin-Like Receptor-Like Protein Kir3Dx1-Like [Manis pentadactyla]